MSPRETLEAAVSTIRTQADVIEKAQDSQELADAIRDIESAIQTLR